MSPVSARMHALLARELLAACGGLDEAAGACRLKKSRLAECQDPAANAFLPIDVVAQLEAYCGRPLYTRALVDARPSAAGESLAEEACEVTEGAAGLQRLARLFEQRHHRLHQLTPRQRLEFDRLALELIIKLEETIATVDGESGLRVVDGGGKP